MQVLLPVAVIWETQIIHVHFYLIVFALITWFVEGNNRYRFVTQVFFYINYRLIIKQ